MEGHGIYSEHSLAQHSAGEYGLPALERAVDVVSPTLTDAPVVVVADLGAAGGRNELAPMTAAIARLRDRGVTGAVTVVHTDIPSNDFTTLFETVEQSPHTYLSLPDVYAFAAGRSFYERIFQPSCDPVPSSWWSEARHATTAAAAPTRSWTSTSPRTASRVTQLRSVMP